MIEQNNPILSLGRASKLLCGATDKNRLAKAFISDSLANGDGDPTKAQIRLYERWAPELP
jgi:2,4-dienoyl-CoA reductase-like NADH-dependent reductase (Old Yellow Enzyme family)|tara:strand:- start:2846 stop:3025 length:180 start_codon:yes stop_codon:yes gene_type:complete